jgi:hypothetical protein
MPSNQRSSLASATILAALGACNAFDSLDDFEDSLHTRVSGVVTDNRGQPVAGATVKLYSLSANTNFVEGGDITSASAYIDKQAVLASTNVLDSGESDDEGRFEIMDVTPGAFLAVATHPSCTAGFAGFDEETGVLNLDTLLLPNFDDGLTFAVPGFVVACSTPPAVGPDGNSDDAPPFDPPASDPICDAALCMSAGGSCEGATCVVTCAAASCTASGGTCMDGACVLPACSESACAMAGGACNGDVCETVACDATACGDAGGTCSADMTTCEIPACIAEQDACTGAGGACSADGSVCELAACTSDADCDAAQRGAYCTNPGDVALAACEPPAVGEIVPPDMAVGWTGLRITDASGNVLADASTDNQTIASTAIPADRIVRVYGDYSGAALRAFVQVQTGGSSCQSFPPRTDFVAVEITEGHLGGGAGNFVELALHGGYQEIQLTTSDVLGEGERSFAVQIADPCTPPQQPFVATLSWDAGPSQPADLDLSIWNAAGELVFVGSKQAAWGQLAIEGKGPGPEVFEGLDAAQGPFTVKVQFFSGKPRSIEGKVRVLRSEGGVVIDDTFTFTVAKPKDIAEIGVFTAG